MRIFCLLPLLLVACTNLPVAMPNKTTAYATMVGGKGTLSYDKYGRPVYTYNNEKSLQHFLQAVTSVVGGLALASTQRAKDAGEATTTQQANSQASQLALQKQKDATALAEQAAKDAKQAAARAAGAPAIVP